MDKIRILNLKIPARHGAYEFEKDSEGLFEIDIEIQVNLKGSVISDQLDNTINYDDLIRVVTDIFTKKDYNLIESVGEKICEKIIEKYPIKKITVRIRKPHAPIRANFDTVEVEITRSK